ncbi:MAG: hypothetical protein CMP69_05315 [Flavobacteriales bacterium]|nr:hypothetical protein [Flavobacteriales bacterium]|tara:strand:+ start:422 stop:1102 length:681 start_codon:yes stop_codon:yes gene_type:complete
MAKKDNKKEMQFEEVGEAISKTEQFIENNQQKIIKVIGIIFATIILVIGIKNFYLKPLENEAQSEMFMAELYFQKDSFNLALNGDGEYLGFLDISNDFSLTKSGNLANYYAGLCFLHLADYENAISYLKDFSSNDIIISSLALGCIGDAYVELGDNEKALKYYKNAVNNSDNQFTSPRYLFKQAMIYESQQEYSKALKIYNLIKDEYKNSNEAAGIEKYISRAENR